MILKSTAVTFSIAACSLLFAWQTSDAQTYSYSTPLPQATYASSTDSTVYDSSPPAFAGTTTAAVMPYAQSSGRTSGQVSAGLAQQKASQAANGQVYGHMGGGLGGAKLEGVGWSNQSQQAAIQNCCYWGTRPVSQIGVSQATNGCWYACVLYQ